MKKNSYMALLLVLLMVATLVGCSAGAPIGTSDKPSGSTSNQTILQDATEWFKQQTTYYEIISSEVSGEQIVFLTGTKNPGTDDYQNLQAFVVKQTDGVYEVTAMKDGERDVSAGFSAHVLATDALTILFGDTSSSVYDFPNDRRLDVDFTIINILLAQGETRAEEITGNAPYLLVFDEVLDIVDLEFVDTELSVKYSTFYSEDLMENAVSDDISGIFAYAVPTDQNSVSELTFDTLDGSEEAGVGFDLDFESDELIVFNNVFGVWGYDLINRHIIFGVDVVKIFGEECQTQGSYDPYAVKIHCSADGKIVAISCADRETSVDPETDRDAYYIDTSTLTYQKGKYQPIENAFDQENVAGYIIPGGSLIGSVYKCGDESWDLFSECKTQ